MVAAFGSLRRWHAPLAWFTAAMLLLSVVTLVAWVVDDRVITGAPAWAKPFKFSVSFVAYAATLAWMVGQLRRWRRVGWWAGTVLVAASVGELAIIVLQVARGQRSHFNTGTALDTALFSAMGGLVAVLYVGTLVIGAVLAVTRVGDAAMTWAVRLGLLVAVAGMSVGFLMVGTTPDAAAAGGPDAVSGAHAVGVADGGPGLPLLGWSTTGGDLRIGHFIGMHALQALPLLALLLAAGPARGLRERTRLHVVLLAAAGYLGIVVLAVWQALRGQPVTAPDAPTLAAAAFLLLATGLGAAAVATAARRSPVRP